MIDVIEIQEDSALTNKHEFHPALSTGAAQWAKVHGERGLVSIIIPTYNRAALLTDLLDSLAEQSWAAIEIIIVDDGSTDNTQDRVAAWVANHTEQRTVQLKKLNGGVASARNLGLEHARGEFIYFIDSDDLIFARAIEEMVTAINDSGAPYCLANIQNTDINSVPLKYDFDGCPRYDPDNVIYCAWLTNAALYRRSAIVRAGAFNESLQLGDDTEFSWRIVSTNKRCVILNKTIGLRRQHDFGHLSIGRPELEMLRDAILANICFIEWAGSHGKMTRGIFFRMVWNFFISALRFGGHGDWYHVNICRETIRAIKPTKRRILYPFLVGTYPKISSYYQILLAIRNVMRMVINRLRALRLYIGGQTWPSIATA